MEILEFKKMFLECLTEDEEFARVVANTIFENLCNIDLEIKKTDERAELPIYGSDRAAGFDLRCILDTDELELKPGQTIPLHTGLSMAIPKGYVGLVFARSGLGCKKGLIPSNAVGVVDSDYRGEVMVALYNHSQETQIIQNNERIAQMVIMPYAFAKLLLVDELDSTERGDGGFGHSGKF